MRKTNRIDLPVRDLVRSGRMMTLPQNPKHPDKGKQQPTENRLVVAFQLYAKSWKKKVGRKRNVVRNGRAVAARQRTRDMHGSLRHTLFTCQVLGLFPTSGLMQQDSYKIRFSWCSFHFVYFAVSVGGQTLMTVMCAYRMCMQGFNLGNLSNIVFYGSALVSAIVFFNIAREWPPLMRQVTEIETSLPGLGRRIVTVCNMCTVSVLLLAIVEHILSILFGVRVAFVCSDRGDMVQTYFSIAVPWIFDYISFSYWKGILSELFNVQSTFMWNFTDVFIMVVSLHLTAHLRLLIDSVHKDKDNLEARWSDHRIRFGKLCRLVRLVDSKVSALVLVSFSCNLFFICLQLFNSLSTEYSGHFSTCNPRNNSHGLEHSVYFTYSFSFLLMRALLVSLLAARVHSAAREPAAALYDVPSQAFTGEVQRFLDQVNFSTVALSGLEFFYVTRGMILTVVGTIVTYELVLLQFTAPAAQSASPIPANENFTNTRT